MNLSNRKLRAMLPAVVVVLPLALSVVSITAESRDHTTIREVVRTGPGGKQATRITDRVREGNTINGNTTVTGPNGGVGTRSTAGQYDADTQTWTRHSEANGPRDRQLSTDASVVRDDNGYSRNVEHKGANGQTATRSTQVVNDQQLQQHTRTSVTTGPDGKSVTTNATVSRTDDGYQREVVKTGPNGGTTTREVAHSGAQ